MFWCWSVVVCNNEMYIKALDSSIQPYMHMFQFETVTSEMVLVAQRDAILLALLVQPFCRDHVIQ